MQEISYRLVFGFSTPMSEILFAALIFKFGGEYGNRTHRQLRAKQPRTPAQSSPKQRLKKFKKLESKGKRKQKRTNERRKTQ